LNKVKNGRVAKANGKGKGATSSFGEGDDDEFVKSENHEMGYSFNGDENGNGNGYSALASYGERYDDANENFYEVGEDGEDEV
jgi:hypothetical protein